MRDPFRWPRGPFGGKSDGASELPELPVGYAFVVDENGAILRDPVGRYLVATEI